jgi:bacterioferritin-associated ferredoxin
VKLCSDIDNHSQLLQGSVAENFYTGTAWMIVCVCNRLNEQRVGAAICGGAACADEVYARCGVRKNCGRCQETIEGMLDQSRAALAQAAE